MNRRTYKHRASTRRASTRRASTRRASTQRASTRKVSTRRASGYKLPKLPKLKKSLRQRLEGSQRKRDAGEAFARGSYGCVFRPVLKCKNNTKIYDKSFVSKLMTRKELFKEIKELKTIKEVFLEHNIGDDFINQYYIVANENDYCEIDLKDITNLYHIKKAVTSSKLVNCDNIYPSLNYVLDNPHKFLLLNMVDGGDSLEKYLSTIVLTETLFNQLNKSLIRLLETGITTMNQIGIYHCDIKPANLVYNKNVRIIDWGLAGIMSLPKSSENYEINSNEIQINTQMYYGLPFTNILVTGKLRKLIRSALQHASPPLNEQTKQQAKQLLKQMFPGPVPSDHFSVLYEFMRQINSEKTITDYAIDNIIEVVYSDVTDEEFFNKVFLHNADIFGFINLYITIHETLSRSSSSSPRINYIKQNIVHLIKKYILTSDYALKPYSIPDIITDLKNLSKPIKIEKITSKLHVSYDDEDLSPSRRKVFLHSITPEHNNSSKGINHAKQYKTKKNKPNH
tara:strand:+ start:4835 stop:6364 length:1530 start_codon:yes stop_codon:yes gene_type:complete